MLLALAALNGDDALDRAGSELAAADSSVRAALDHLRRVADETRTWLPDVPVHFDLAELRGYHYKTGVVFAAFVPGWGQEIARGGRYDDIGRVFGRARPAVGFSTDLKGLLRHGLRLSRTLARKAKRFLHPGPRIPLCRMRLPACAGRAGRWLRSCRVRHARPPTWAAANVWSAKQLVG